MTIDALKSARATLGLSQAELAARIGVAPNTVSRWEAGRHPIPRWVSILIRKLS